MAAQAALGNDFENFLQRLKDIQTGKNENIIKSTLFKNYDIPLDEDELDLLAFFDGVLLYHGVTIKIPGYSDQNWKKEFKLFKEPNVTINVQNGLTTLNEKTIKELVSFLKSSPKPLACTLTGPYHVVTLALSENKELFLVDQDDVSTIFDDDNSIKKIISSLKEWSLQSDLAEVG